MAHPFITQNWVDELEWICIDADDLRNWHLHNKFGNHGVGCGLSSEFTPKPGAFSQPRTILPLWHTANQCAGCCDMFTELLYATFLNATFLATK